jgi:hypothetical protein
MSMIHSRLLSQVRRKLLLGCLSRCYRRLSEVFGFEPPFIPVAWTGSHDTGHHSVQQQVAPSEVQ